MISMYRYTFIMARQCYFSTSEEQLLCKGELRTISFSTPISEERRQELEGKCLCQTHYNHEVVNKNYYQKHQTKLNEYCAHPKHSIYKQSTKKKEQTKSKDALINLPVRFYKILELDSTAKICHRCIKFTDQDPDYITSNDYIQAIKRLRFSQNSNNIETQKTIRSVKPIQDLSKSMKYKRYKKVATSFPKVFYNEVQSTSHPNDKIILNEVIFLANEQQFRVI
ncbi:hypothetical protein C2G38_1564679 [Gigaspora rosea]|uniref:Uncharacterized protein n=1 Tax=Gigaspora rosea TaxID=44941 RepID=A0A397W4G3_9GLOM|nr:hypothetical protein C2G38_1564679 [Gigaspora rosea]